MALFPIQIDATQLVFRWFLLPPTVPGFNDATVVQTLQLAPGEYNYQFASGSYADFTFTVTATGTIAYKPQYAAFLDGQGTQTLTLRGFPLTIDASALSGSGVLFADFSSKTPWVRTETIRVLPASWYRVQQGSGQVTDLVFKVGLDGMLSYSPASDVAEGGFLSGNGTAKLTFRGYTVNVDGSALGGTSWGVLSVFGLPFGTQATLTLDLLPAALFQFRSASREIDDLAFSLDASGRITFDGALASRMRLAAGPNGIPTLTLLPRAGSTGPTVPAKLPIIDPDLIGPDDFRLPGAAAAANTAFGIWQRRRVWVDQTLQDLRAARSAGGASGFDQALGLVFGPTLPDLDGLYQSLVNGDTGQTSGASTAIEALGFSADSFSRLMELRAADVQSRKDPRVVVSDDDWEEVYAILAQVEKVGRSVSWRSQEGQLGLTLGLEDFWISLREPVLGDWPPRQLVAGAAPAVPLIDPDLQTLKDLPEPVAGADAIALWNGRATVVKAKRVELAAARESGSFDAMLRLALGGPLPDLTQLRTDLASSDPNVVSAAEQVITTNLHLTISDFTQLMAIRDRDGQADPQKKPTASEYAQAATIATKGWKTGTAYPQWIRDEAAAFGNEAQALRAPPPTLAYWRARKAALPRWRASVEARQAWQQALLARSAPPIIDPDIVGQDDLRAPVTGSGALDLWSTRSTDITSRLTAIRSQAPSTVVFDGLVRQYLGVGDADLAALEAARDNGQDLQPRLDQLCLTYPAFLALRRIRRLLVASKVLDSEWSDVASILVQAYKVRQYAAWRNGEAAASPPIILGPDLFQIPPPPTDPLVQVTPWQPPAWRATAQARRDWQDTLQSRIDQQSTVIQGMRDAVLAAEDASLDVLRSGLILATQPFVSDLDRAAEWVTRRFLIDAKVSPKQTTTRVEQAIETIQGLVTTLSSRATFNPTGIPTIAGLACASTPEIGRVDLFVRAADNGLWQKARDTAGRWTDWQYVDGGMKSDPAVCSRDGRLSVFAVRQDGSVWMKQCTDRAWSPWTSLGIPPGAALYAGTVASVDSAADGLMVFLSVVGGDLGTTAGIWYRHFQAGAWLPWTRLVGSTFFVRPAAAVRGPGRIDLLCINLFDGGDLVRTRYTDGVWGTFNVSGADQWPTTTPAVVFDQQSDGAAEVFLRGPDDILYAGGYSDGVAWSGLVPLGTTFALASSPTAAALPQSMEVFVLGAVDGAVWQGTWNNRNQAFSQFFATEPSSLTLEASDLETTWHWLGSYATWRAAMLVFLYPDNLLLPTLRPDAWQTDAFRTLSKTLSAGAVTAALACTVAGEYAAYANDVCSLSIEATCHGLMRIPSDNPCAGAGAPQQKQMFFMFARSRLTKKLYWTAYDFLASSESVDYAELLWREIVLDGDASSAGSLRSIQRIVGAKPFAVGATLSIPGEPVICVVAQFQGEGGQKLGVLALNLDDLTWSPKANDLKLPFAPAFFDVVMEQDMWALAELWGSFPVRLEVLIPGHGLHVGELNNDLNDWATGPAQDWSHPYEWRPLALVSQGLIGESNALVWRPAEWSSQGFPNGWAGEGLNPRANDAYHGTLWLRAPNASSTFSVLVLADFSLGSGGTVDHWTYMLHNQSYRQPGIATIDDIVPNAGIPIGGDPPQFVYRRLPDGAYRRCTFLWQDANGPVLINTDDPILPKVRVPITMPCELNSADSRQRQQQIEQAYQDNGGYPASLLTVLDEAFYFVPIHLALQLQRSGEFEAALGWFRTVYDYTAPKGDLRKIYYGLKAEESLSDGYTRASTWLTDPLNPHAIGKTRRNTYTRFTVCSIIRCLLDYADSEFSQDTGESVARARVLYQTALDLSDIDELRPPIIDCPPVVDALSAIQLSSMEARRSVDRARTKVAPRLSDVVGAGNAWREQQFLSLAARPEIAAALETVGAASAVPSLRAAYMPSALPLWGCVPPRSVADALRLHAALNLKKVRSGRNIAGMKRELDPYGAPTSATSALPTIGTSGQLLLPGVVTIQPTLYRYSVLVDRAKQLTQTAAQMEAAMLAALEQQQSAAYGILRARQDLGIAQATVRLQELKIGQANDNVKLAGLQRQRVDVQIKHFTDLLEKPISDDEQAGLNLLADAAEQQAESASWSESAADTLAAAGVGGLIAGAGVGALIAGLGSGFIGGAISHIIGGELGGGGALAAIQAAAGAQSARAAFHSSLAAGDSTNAAIMSTRAAYERRREDWNFQLQLASQDAGIGDEQVAIAKDEVGVATQEKTIADAQRTNASDTLAFLNNAFLTPDLFSWMAGVLQGIYDLFLRQATAIARLAENQLAFERQQGSAGYIQGDYWAIQNGTQVTTSTSPDRKGLTGAERLLQDIAQLDQYAFLTDVRKLQLVKTFSLDRIDPAGLQRFRETGLLTFATPMEAFDRDFPGHYLRLIKRVSTSVIALIPPGQGIAATLSSSGVSRVVIGGDAFQVIPIRRSPESVSLCSPLGATGILQLTPQGDTMLLPFEGSGVDTFWEFRMEKASNLFDYTTIADILITIEYTALSDADYRQQVIQALDPTITADRPYSFRNQFADQWYDLHNPDQAATPMTIRFSTLAEDFPPNLGDLRIRQVLLYFSRADGTAFEIDVSSFRFKETGAAGFVGGAATSIDGAISTRRGNAGSWTAMIGKRATGDWELVLPNGEDLKGRFANDEIRDVLFVITYSAMTPERQ